MVLHEGPGQTGKRFLRIVIAVGVFVGVIGIGAFVFHLVHHSSTSHGIGGGITLTDSSAGFKAGAVCAGTGGYDDMHAGADVVITDQDNKTIATGALVEGISTADDQCWFAFGVPHVPSARFYKVAVSHRGGVTKSKAEMVADGWKVDLTLGS